MARDYRKFLKDDGTLNVRYLPRPIYVEILKRYQRHDQAIVDVFESQRWRWDLEKREKDAAAAGIERSRGEVAAEIMAGMDDRDWWAMTEAFEKHLAEHFAERAEEWADLLDPVYDWQEREGWADRHYAPFPASAHR